DLRPGRPAGAQGAGIHRHRPAGATAQCGGRRDVARCPGDAQPPDAGAGGEDARQRRRTAGQGLSRIRPGRGAGPDVDRRRLLHR
ncbi:hypothetical protein DQE80_16380, partial [Enterococcus sp. HPCN18]